MACQWSLLSPSILAALILLQGSSTASEREIIKAVNSAALALQSEVSLPSDVSRAAPLPGGLNESEHMLYSITASEISAITNKAYPLMTAKWPFDVVYVCWENPRESELAQRTLVREAIVQTWEKHSALEFIGWKTCTPNFTGIRIAIADEGPHVKFLGKYLGYAPSGESRVVERGMVLNFTFLNWSTSCQSRVDYCIRTIAVHEFGHAIGFAHEQNRPDTPGECTQPPQGPDGDTTSLTPWDEHSVMNYCNDRYNNDGELSEFDIKAVRYVYGTR